MESFDPDRFVERYNELAHHEIATSLFHAKVSALNAQHFCELAFTSVSAPIHFRNAVRARLNREDREESASEQYDELAEKLIQLDKGKNPYRRQTNSLLSVLYSLLSPPCRHLVLNHWEEAGTKDCANRWLKAIEDDPLLLSEDRLFAHWERFRSVRAAYAVAKHSLPNTLTQYLSELISKVDEGWIVSKAALRASAISDRDAQQIKEKFPSTYLYLAAKLGWLLTPDEAFETALNSCKQEPSNIGLSIWSIGQLRMWNTLEKIETAADEFERILSNRQDWSFHE